MKKEVIAFRRTVVAGNRGSQRERLKDKGYVQEVRIRFYAGVENVLEVRPYVLHKNNRAEDLFTYPEGTRQHVVGDNDYLIFPVNVDFDYDDEIVVDFLNNNATYPYTLSVDVIVVYHVEEVVPK
jgi:hypothetical protein